MTLPLLIFTLLIFGIYLKFLETSNSFDVFKIFTLNDARNI